MKRRARWLIVTLNTPPLNWLTIAMMKEINEALMDVLKDASLQLLVFDHAGEKAFSSGAAVEDHTEDKVDEMIDVFHRMFRHMVEIDIPIVGVVNGVALGGGCELISFLRYGGRIGARRGSDSRRSPWAFSRPLPLPGSRRSSV